MKTLFHPCRFSFLDLVINIFFFFAAAAAVLPCFAIVRSPDPEYLASLAREVNTIRNVNVDPCDSFYDYACGGWINRTILPDDEFTFSRSFTTITNRNRMILRKILESKIPLLSEFYRSCLDTETLESLGSAPIQHWLSLFSVRRIPSKRHFFSRSADLYRKLGYFFLFSLEVDTDPGHPSKQILTLSQSGLSLPLADYTDNSNKTILLRQHIQRMLQFLGESEIAAATQSEEVVELEKKIAKFTKSPVELRNPHLSYNPMILANLNSLAPYLYLSTYFRSIRINSNQPIEQQQINVLVPSFFSNLSHLVQTTNIRYFLSHAKWRIIHGFAPDLSEAFRVENWRFFSHFLAGAKKPEERWKECVGKSNSLWTNLLDRLYLALAFPADSEAKAEALITSIRRSFLHNLNSADWMSERTKEAAVKKSLLIRDFVGGSKKTVDYSSLTISPTTLFENIVQLRALRVNETLKKLDLPSDPFNDWQMAASTVNAYYEPTLNTMNFPAGILQPPFFSRHYPAAMNYGGIGVVIGHELIHGFDDEGRQYNGAGVLQDWWDNSSISNFSVRTQCLVKEYESMQVNTTTFPHDKINGNLTLGENIADNSGLHIAFEAFHHSNNKSDHLSLALLPCLSPPLNSSNQLFFLSYAWSWCNIMRPQRQHTLLQSDPHSPAKARVDGALRNSQEFAESFNCPEGSRMNPYKKCSLY